MQWQDYESEIHLSPAPFDEIDDFLYYWTFCVEEDPVEAPF